MRESPSLKLIEIYREKGANVEYHDPLIPVLPKTRKYKFDMKSVKLSKEKLKSFDLVVLSTDHSIFDYKFIGVNSKIIIDPRNAFETRGIRSKNIFKA
jgi:UDP-N-acetyl-D-glucosamine dehydrogenase